MGLKEQILAAKRKIEKVHVPDLGMDLFMRPMTGFERNIYQTAELKADADKATIGLAAVLPLYPLLISLTVCDESGKRVFGNPAEVQELDSTVISVLANKALEVNGITDAAREAIEKKFMEANRENGSGSI